MVMDYKAGAGAGAGAGTEAQQYVWKGAIPLQIHLHDSEVTTLPPPTDALILAPRLGYLPLLVPKIKPFFSSSLPPGVDTVWFEYKGLPLKWHIPTGVLFDLLCAEPERPWKLTVHFRGYPGHILTPCEGEENVKRSFKNSLKEAAYIINGNCKNVMNLSQFDDTELWNSVVNGLPEVYFPISSKLKLDITGEEFLSSASKSQESTDEPETSTSRTDFVASGRIPVRLYIRSINEDIDDLEDAPIVDSWEKISYINHPIEIQEGKCYTLNDAIKELLPDLFKEDGKSSEQTGEPSQRESGEMKLVRIQGIEPKMEIPFSWLVNNLMNPDHYLHISIYVVKVLLS